MTAIFRPSANLWMKLALLGAAGFVLGGTGWWWLAPRTDWACGVGFTVQQPVPFSHQHHVAGLGIGCQTCHSHVEVGANAGLPPTHTCMTCHSQIWTNADVLAPVRQSLAEDRPLRWQRVNNLPARRAQPHGVLDLPPLTPAQRWRRVLEDPEVAAHAFPSLAGAMESPRRRGLLKLMAASFALGGLSGCGDPAESDNGWVPAVEAPPGIVPGLPNRYATASLAGGAGLGLVVEHRMGRPVKVEGNPLHPASLGATDALAQALVLDFYDPDRAAGVLREGQPATLGDLLDILVPARASLFASHGAGLRVLTGACVSLTLGAALEALLARLPEARWHQ